MGLIFQGFGRVSAVSVDNFVDILRAPGARPHGCVGWLGCMKIQQKKKILMNQSSFALSRVFQRCAGGQMSGCAASKNMCTS
ncbi:hypothetical protein [Extensimonas sp. H3M7-6]|uniref:hypothetical protein n=1 Tax=Extensimonas soli TaxID=3031322 RepID=UPI0023DA8563|nr:hypothetical protein [Extensimonas sp. H3M7-6]MDF1481362.1 hypothetical protein [Extensimonas sp. H3M7-6]